MFAKVWTVAAAAVVAGALVLPAPAAYAQTSTAPAAKPMAKKHMAKTSAHRKDCYDYAWQSAAMSDCLAKGTSKASASKPMKKAPKKKVTTS